MLVSPSFLKSNCALAMLVVPFRMFKPPSFKFPKSVTPSQTTPAAAAANASETAMQTANANVNSSGDTTVPTPSPQNDELSKVPAAVSSATDDDDIAEEVEYDEVRQLFLLRRLK
jgi:hypothetical protein